MNANEPAPTLGLSLPFTKAADPNSTYHEEAQRLPLIHRVPNAVRNHFVAMVGEFVGTTLFLYFALSGTQVANSIKSSAGLTVEETGANPQQLQYISLCFGFSLAVFAWVFFRISGGLFNPAVTLGMCLIGALPWVRGVLLFFSQILGGLSAAALVSCMFPGDLNVRTTLGGGTTVVQGLFIEMILTAQLVFTIFMLAAEKHKGTFIAPVGIGLSLFIAELTGVYFTGGSLNPARSFGPAVVDHQFETYHWIYWVGPILGSIVAAGFFKFIKALEYESANPGQDAAEAAMMAEKHRQSSIAAGNPAGTISGVHGTHGLSNDYGASKNDVGYTNGTNAVNGRAAATGFGGGLATRDDAAAGGFGGAIHRPENRRLESTRIRDANNSPAPNTTDNAYHGLAHGMHGDVDGRPANSRTITAGSMV